MSAGNQVQAPLRRRPRFTGWMRGAAAALSLIACAAPAQNGKSPRSSSDSRVQNGEASADACTSCHGIGGHSQGYIPSLAGARRTDLMRQLRAFRAQTGQATIMNRIVRGYSDSELEALADYFSSRPGP